MPQPQQQQVNAVAGPSSQGGPRKRQRVERPPAPSSRTTEGAESDSDDILVLDPDWTDQACTDCDPPTFYPSRRALIDHEREVHIVLLDVDFRGTEYQVTRKDNVFHCPGCSGTFKNSQTFALKHLPRCCPRPLRASDLPSSWAAIPAGDPSMTRSRQRGKSSPLKPDASFMSLRHPTRSLSPVVQTGSDASASYAKRSASGRQIRRPSQHASPSLRPSQSPPPPSPPATETLLLPLRPLDLDSSSKTAQPARPIAYSSLVRPSAPAAALPRAPSAALPSAPPPAPVARPPSPPSAPPPPPPRTSPSLPAQPPPAHTQPSGDARTLPLARQSDLSSRERSPDRPSAGSSARATAPEDPTAALKPGHGWWIGESSDTLVDPALLAFDPPPAVVPLPQPPLSPAVVVRSPSPLFTGPVSTSAITLAPTAITAPPPSSDDDSPSQAQQGERTADVEMRDDSVDPSLFALDTSLHLVKVEPPQEPSSLLLAAPIDAPAGGAVNSSRLPSPSAPLEGLAADDARSSRASSSCLDSLPHSTDFSAPDQPPEGMSIEDVLDKVLGFAITPASPSPTSLGKRRASSESSSLCSLFSGSEVDFETGLETDPDDELARERPAKSMRIRSPSSDGGTSVRRPARPERMPSISLDGATPAPAEDLRLLCARCPERKSFKSKIDLNQHTQAKHPVQESRAAVQEPATCNLCQPARSFATATAKMQHTRQKHSNQKVPAIQSASVGRAVPSHTSALPSRPVAFQCSQCRRPVFFADQLELDHHVYSEHGWGSKRAGNRHRSCIDCPGLAKFDSTEDLDSHHKIAHPAFYRTAIDIGWRTLSARSLARRPGGPAPLILCPVCQVFEHADLELVRNHARRCSRRPGRVSLQ